MPSIHFYDAVTFGNHPAEGQLLRYDFVRYSGKSQEAATYPVRLRDDVFVDPDTAEDGDVALLDFEQGLTELQWARIAHQHFTAPDTLHVAYGATGRLEQFIRFGMYRNLLPFPSVGLPGWLHYLDLETLALAVRLLRPDEFPWQDLKAVPPQSLHHALTWDCRLQEQNRAVRTQELLKQLYSAAPRIVEHAIRMSSLREMKTALGLDDGEVSDLAAVRPSLFFHPSTSGPNVVLLALPVAVDVTYPDVLWVADLQADLSDLCDPGNKQLKALVRTRPNDTARPLVRVSLSRLPFCAPLNTIRASDALRLGVDMPSVRDNIKRLRQSGYLANRLKGASLLELPGQPFDIYHRMWAGDFPHEDQDRMRQLHGAQPGEWLRISAEALDGRFLELGARLLGREHPEALPVAQQGDWKSYVQSRACGDSNTPDWVAKKRKRAQDSALTFPAAVGLVKLNERLTRIFG